jgi:hypothetical protein
MMKKKTYMAPITEVTRVYTDHPFMEWSNQTVDGQDTGDFEYAGEGGEGIPADAKGNNFQGGVRLWED